MPTPHLPSQLRAQPPLSALPSDGNGPTRFARSVKIIGFALLLAWLSLVLWNSAKPLPPGTHMVSQTARLSEADVDFVYQSPLAQAAAAPEMAAIDHAEQLIVLDRSPVSVELARRVLARKRQRPNLKIVVVTDPGNEAFGGTAASTLASMEQAGIIVARVRLDRLRDSNPLYSGLWRLVLGWWSDPFDEVPGEVSPSSWLRTLNFKADQRQLVLADDGAGGWIAIQGYGGGPMLVLRGSLARAAIASELQIAAWSTQDDRLPPSPRAEGRGVGSIDARFLTEGAIEGALLDALSAARGGDQICITAENLGDRRLIAAMLSAAARGATLQVLLARNPMPNQPVAGELLGGSGRIEIRWYPTGHRRPQSGLLLVKHRADVWLNLGSADFTRRNLGDLNLETAVELRLPARAAAARAAMEYFAGQWSDASAEADFAPDSSTAYWRYRFAETTGLSSF